MLKVLSINLNIMEDMEVESAEWHEEHDSWESIRFEDLLSLCRNVRSREPKSIQRW